MDELTFGRELFQSVREQAEGGEFPDRKYKGPVTFTAANAEVQRREDERKLREDSKRDSRSKTRSAGTDATAGQPGKCIGSRRDDMSAWWLVMEDYFREVSKEDVLNILPRSEELNPLLDRAFRIPRVGRDVDGIDEAGLWSPRNAKKQRTVGPDEETDEQQHSDGGGTQDGEGTRARRSHRLASKQAARDSVLSPFPETSSPRPASPEVSTWLSIDTGALDGSKKHLLSLCKPEEVQCLADQLSAIEDEGSEPRPHGINGGMEETTQQIVDRLCNLVTKEVPDASPTFREDVLELLKSTDKAVDPPVSSPPPTSNGCIKQEPHTLPQQEAAEPDSSQEDDMMSEVCHPYTQLLLNSPVPPHTFEWETARGFAGNTPMHGSPSTPQRGQINEGGAPRQSAGPSGFRFPCLQSPEATPVLSSKGFGNSESNGGGSGGEGGSSVVTRRKRKDVDYNVLAGRKVVPAQNQTGNKRAAKMVVAQPCDDPPNPTVQAVQNAILAGSRDEGLDVQWERMDKAMEGGLLEFAPDDEIIAEIVGCQAELVQQVATNRRRLKRVLEGVLEHKPIFQEQAEKRQRMEKEMQECVAVILEHKRGKQREKREASKKHKFAQKEVENTVDRVRRTRRPKPFVEDSYGPPSSMSVPRRERTNSQFKKMNLVDPYTERSPNADAWCVVCGDGQSDQPNVIVFCERCDIAVHQDCYGVSEVPSGEWLCWPCRLYEEECKAKGMSLEEIRPKREEMDDVEGGAKGGSRAVSCAMCPVKCGAFKQSVDGKRWVHVVCAHSHRETSVLPGNICNAVEGLTDIPNSRWNKKCDFCRKSEGVVMKCSHGNCAKQFHPLCARREGTATIRPIAGQTSHFTRSAYCSAHSPSLKPRESLTPAQAVRNLALQKDKSGRGLDAVRGSDLMDGHESPYGQTSLQRGQDALVSDEDGGFASLDSRPGSAPFGPPMSDVDRRKALEMLAAKERAFEDLTMLRNNLDAVRVLSDQCKKRERQKLILANTRIDVYRTVVEDVPKYEPYLSQVFPSLLAEALPSGAVADSVGGITLSVTPPLLERGSAASSRGRGGGPRSTRATIATRRTQQTQEEDMELQSGRRNPRGAPRTGRRTSDLILETPPPPLSAPGGRSTRATARRTRNATQSSMGAQQDTDLAVSQNDTGPSNVQEGSVEMEIPRRGVPARRSRARRVRGDSGARLAPERAMTNDEVREINSELRHRGYAYVRQDQMEAVRSQATDAGGVSR